MEKEIYTVYMLMRRDGKFYVNYIKGEEKGIFEEFKKHSNGEIEQTREFLPVLLVYIQKFNKIEEVKKRLKDIKKMNKERKIKLIKTGINTFIPEVKIADKVQILFSKNHGMNRLRYIKESNPQIDYTVCFNPNCPEHCNNSFLIVNKSSVEEVPDKSKRIQNPNQLISLIRYYKKKSNENSTELTL